MQRIFFFCSLLLLSLACSQANAQDRIYLRDGSIVEAKVKEIDTRNVVYRRWDNQDGADYIVTKREVERIVYQNGTEERFSGRGPVRRENGTERMTGKSRSAEGWGKNLLAFAPIQMTNEGVAGVGLLYQRFIDKAQMFAIALPVGATFYTDDATTNYPVYRQYTARRVFAKFYPGLKIYPGGSTRRVAYSIGPSFLLGSGNKFRQVTRVEPNGSYSYTYEEVSVFKAGFIVNNGLNVQATKNLYLGVELGLGILYYNNEYDGNLYGSINDEPEVQFNFRIGYRW